MKRPIIIFVLVTVLSAGMVVYGWNFVSSQISEAVLTEETITGNSAEAEELKVGFRADSLDNLHWVNSYNFGTEKTTSTFTMGEMEKKADTSVYDNFRFTGWSGVPFTTQLKNDNLEGLQNKKLQKFYDVAQHNVMSDGGEVKGTIRLDNYLDYYPISFKFQFGSKQYNSDNALTGLKIYDEKGKPSSVQEEATDAKYAASYDPDINLYVTFNKMFKIPVLQNEYQGFEVSKSEKKSTKNSLGYETKITKPLDGNKDYYEFDPILFLQEENTKDGVDWQHPGNSKVDMAASQQGLKNRLLFVVNNKTAKGSTVDVSQLTDGYGVYSLPIDTVVESLSITDSKRALFVGNPVPKVDEMKMVYPLNDKVEYVEMSMSRDHRYLALFSIKDGAYFVELIDADKWTSQGAIKVFSASEKMTYNWGNDGSLAATNHKGDIAVFAKTQNGSKPYELLYSGKVDNDLDQALFDSDGVAKQSSYSKYKCGIDSGLAISVKEGKAALVENLQIGNGKNSIRNAALECAIIDKNGVVYRGKVKNNIVDIDYGMNQYEKLDSKSDKDLIKPVKNENWVLWK